MVVLSFFFLFIDWFEIMVMIGLLASDQAVHWKHQRVVKRKYYRYRDVHKYWMEWSPTHFFSMQDEDIFSCVYKIIMVISLELYTIIMTYWGQNSSLGHLVYFYTGFSHQQPVKCINKFSFLWDGRILKWLHSNTFWLPWIAESPKGQKLLKIIKL